MKTLIFFIISLATFSGSIAYGQDAAGHQTMSLKGLKDRVTIRRDDRDIPYIEAENETDLFFVQGFVTAMDRLWQMDLLRRVGSGRTAEIFGAATLEEDKRWRRFNFSAIAERSVASDSPDVRAALESYAAGVNAYISTLDDDSLPLEFKVLQYKPEPWRTADTIIVGKILADALSTTWRNDILRASLDKFDRAKYAELQNQTTPFDVVLFGKDATGKGSKIASAGSFKQVDVTENTLDAASVLDNIRSASLERVGLFAEELAASNNWVISGKRTADGKAMLANDPHLAPTAPGIWYLMHLSAPGMRVSGAAIPGIPGIVLGHNENIAWGATNVAPDVQDVYLETFNADGTYKTPTGNAKPVIRTEQFRVKTNPLKPDTQTVSIEVVDTINGPVIFEENGKKYSLRWTALNVNDSELEAFYRLNKASNWEEFKAGLRKYRGATQNFVYADTKGNIGWQVAGQIPIRRKGSGELPYDGATTDGDWIGFIEFDQLPVLFNPPSGFIVTANQRIVGTSYKYPQLNRDPGSPWRARRIFDRLSSNNRADMDFVNDVQHDTYNIPLVHLAKAILKVKAASPETLSDLQKWDGKMVPDSRAALVVNEIRNCTANKIADENKPVPAFLIRERILDDIVAKNSMNWLPKQFSSYAALFKACDGDVSNDLSKRFGSDKTRWVWGSYFKSRFPHPLAAVPFIGGQFAAPAVAIAGSGQTPNVGSAVSMRHIATPGKWDETRHVIPLGESGDPRSPFFKDQFEAWKDGTTRTFPFSKDAVSAAAKSIVLLVPKP